MTPFERVAHDLEQGGRVAWFLGHSLLAQRLVAPAAEPPVVRRPMPTRAVILDDLFALLRRDRANIANGHYRRPLEWRGGPLAALRQSGRFFADLSRVDRRRHGGRHDDLPETGTAGLPDYYRRNFHYQTDGYLSAESAQLYDFQVEVLFNGGADAMRRQALVPIASFLRGRNLRVEQLLDVACGTGRFLATVKHNYPRLRVTGVDLSRPYLAKAEAELRPWSWVGFAEGAAEALPIATASQSLVTCIYLFHELPRQVRQQAAAEIARVLRPGGRAILVDSIQIGDHPPFDGLLEFFPQFYHEPYYAGYVRADLHALFAGVGLRVVATERAYMSKVLVLTKPEAC